MFKAYTFTICFILLKAIGFGQILTCPSSVIYFQNGSISAFNTSLPISSTNPSNIAIPQLAGSAGLALMPNISGGTLSPTFYTSKTGTYYYWDGATWVNTGSSTGSGGINLGGCGTVIYSLIGSTVYTYTGTITTLLTTLSETGLVADIVPDCNCNFYTFNASTSRLTKYSPAGTMITTYTLVNIPVTFGGGGYAIVGNNVYYVGGSTMYVGSIGVGSIITFTALPGSIGGGADWASCPVDINAVPVSATINVPASACQSASVMALTNNAVTYTWSGPGITGAGNGYVITVNTTGIYTCTVFSNGCGPLPSLTLTTAVSNNTCITVASTSITCASLGSATVSAPGGSVYSYTWMPSAQTGSVATGLSPGTYTLTVHDPLNNITYITTTSFNSLIPLSGNVSNSASITCNGAATGTATLNNLTGGSGSQSYLWTNGANSYTQASPANLSTGIWSLTVTDLLTGCTLNQSFFINQPPALTLAIGAGSPSICLGSGNIVLTGTASGGSNGYTYTWTVGPSGNTQTASQGLAGNYVYTLNAANVYSCHVSQTIAIDFVPNPLVSVNNISICPLQTGTLSASGATSYTWNNASTGSTFTDNPPGNQQYSVVGSALGCTASATGSIILKPLPALTINQSSVVC